MHTRVLLVNPTDPDESAVALAAEVIRRGGLVAFPTETVYGLGADGLNEAAVHRAYEVKGRPRGRGLILHVQSPAWLQRLGRSVPQSACALADEFWPGPLTIVVRRAASIPAEVCGGSDKVAIRAPDHPVAQALIRAADTPIAAPSANVSGHLSPSTAQHVLADLEGSIDLVLDGGECPLGIESTVLDVVSSPPRILRPGAVPVQEIRRLLENVAVADADPERRYAPAARMVLVEACAGTTTLAEVVRAERRRGRRVALVATQEGAAAAPCEIVAMWREPPAGRVEREFFARLREAEQTGADVIVVQAPPETPKTSVLLHRLRSAATEFVGADGPSRLNEADCDYDDTSP